MVGTKENLKYRDSLGTCSIIEMLMLFDRKCETLLAAKDKSIGTKKKKSSANGKSRMHRNFQTFITTHVSKEHVNMMRFKLRPKFNAPVFGEE